MRPFVTVLSELYSKISELEYGEFHSKSETNKHIHITPKVNCSLFIFILMITTYNSRKIQYLYWNI